MEYDRLYRQGSKVGYPLRKDTGCRRGCRAFPPLALGHVNGFVSLLPGIYSWRHFPESAFWVIALVVAGLWETWRGPDGAAVETVTILTTTANDRVRPYPDRRPVIVAPPDFATWLDAARPPAEVERPFAPAPAASLTATPVCGWVNDVRHEGPRCLEAPEVVAGDEPVLFAS